MQLDKSPTRMEPTSVAILLGTLEKLGETVPRDTLCVPEKCHGVMPNSWPKSLTTGRMIDHGIESLSEAKVPVKNAYRMSPTELAELQKQLNKLLSIGFSRLVQSSCGASILSLKKKNKSLRWCIEHRTLNQLMIRCKYPFSILLNPFCLCGVKYFSKLDDRLGYYRVRMAEGDRSEMTCVTGHEEFEFFVVPFSLTDAIATFVY
ncbi:RNA-directed DNA polymerase-like protein [Cucumis melo var. makuwa]|uniref:RNA-directed DNA polymerase-like protein n=1 Tax=Cucumis melo var. makuwa TaxID=1194695 RepID=A0A5A7T9I9_CUCMM|nr:RNA-directed DNA polymerase-like protein [Cucumis melo var. makuwa]